MLKVTIYEMFFLLARQQKEIVQVESGVQHVSVQMRRKGTTVQLFL